MQPVKSDFDIILNILQSMLIIKPDSVFIKSIHQQYCERGSLSKKQLEGLHSIAAKTERISVAKLATLEAIIKKKPTRYRSELPKPVIKIINEGQIEKIEQILTKYPGHKRILFFKAKYDNKEALSTAEIAELDRLHKLLACR